MCSCVPPIPHPSIIDCVDRSSISVCFFFSPALFHRYKPATHPSKRFVFFCVCVLFSLSLSSFVVVVIPLGAEPTVTELLFGTAISTPAGVTIQPRRD